MCDLKDYCKFDCKYGALLRTVPVFYRAGYIIARKERVRRSTDTMETDPYTIIVSLYFDSQAHDYKSKGRVYLDDGNSFDYQSGVMSCVY